LTSSVCAIFSLIAGLATAAPAAAIDFPAPTSHVVDGVRAMDSALRSATAQQLEAFEARSGIHVAVAVITSPKPLSIEDYGAELFRHWSLDTQSQGRTALLVIATSPRVAAIKVGSALTGIIDNEVAGLILANRVAPHLEVNGITGAATRGADAIREVLRQGPAGLRASGPEQVSWLDANRDRMFLNFLGGLVLFLCLAVLINIATAAGLLPKRRRGARRVLDWITGIAGAVSVSSSESPSRSSGRTGSDRFAAGGGTAGGGGASGSW
jgi:uncharacterized protein